MLTNPKNDKNDLKLLKSPLIGLNAIAKELGISRTSARRLLIRLNCHPIQISRRCKRFELNKVAMLLHEAFGVEQYDGSKKE